MRKSRSSHKPQITAQPKPPFPIQHQTAPGLESKIHPAPEWNGKHYRAARESYWTKSHSSPVAIRAWPVCRLFLCAGRRGYRDRLPAREQSDAENTKQSVEALGRSCLLLPADLTRPEAPNALVKNTIKAYGKLDILVSNAAHQASKNSIEKLTDAELSQTFETNVYAYARLVRAAVPHLKAGASIIATSSVTGILGTEGLPDYSSTKGAINALTKTLAMDLIEREEFASTRWRPAPCGRRSTRPTQANPPRKFPSSARMYQ